MYVLGVVGGVASGKSFFARVLEQQGAVLIDADNLGHEVLAEPEVIEAFRQRWGECVVDAAGKIIRREVASRVFGNDANATREREFLNSVTHPRIRDHLREQLNQLRASKTKVVMLDAALLYETGWSQLCDGVVFIDVPQNVRLQRAQLRGWSPEQFHAREASQWPVADKQARATWTIPNDDQTDLTENVAAIWTAIVAEPT